jgi:hypothetical protein
MKQLTAAVAIGFLAAGCGMSDPLPALDPGGKLDVLDEAPYPIDFPRKREAAAAPRAGARTVQYYGGPVIANPKVYVVWWGSASRINPALTAAHGGIADYFTGITSSTYLDWLNEYDTAIATQAGSKTGTPGTGQHLGRGNYAGSFALTTVPAGNVTDDQIQATLSQAVDNGALPHADDDTIYAIYFPRGVTITLTGDGSSCSSFGAYHFAVTGRAQRLYYLVIPDCGSSFRGFSVVTSHELVEAMTDAIPTPGSNPDFPQAWNDAQGSEVGDLCESTSGRVTTATGTFSVQGIWDEASGRCPIFRAYARDFNVSLAQPQANVAVGASTSAVVHTATVAGAAQTLQLALVAPPGVTATLSPTHVTSGQSATLTFSAASALSAGQIIVRVTGTTGSATQVHSAALLINAR